MIKISAVIVVKNEENNILNCLKTLKFVDEIIVVDNGSTDQTLKIAENQNIKIIKSVDIDFANLRNIGKDNALYNWLLYIDADERVSQKLASEIRRVIENSKYDAYSISRKNFFYGRQWPNQEKIIRLIKKESLDRWFGKIHETAKVNGEIGALKEELLHYTHDNLSKMVNKTNDWSKVEAKLRFEDKHPSMCWWRFIRVMTTSFCNTFFRDGGLKMGTLGLVESLYQSFSTFITYAKLWELQNAEK
jgi:glycosyltransferase involved in cell wall biosynthesis